MTCLSAPSPLAPIAANRNLTDDGFRGITRLADSLTQLVLEGGHQVSEDGATALASLTRLQALQLAYRCGRRGSACSERAWAPALVHKRLLHARATRPAATT